MVAHIDERALRSSLQLLREAAAQGASGGATAAVVGVVAAMIAGMFAVAQVEGRQRTRLDLDCDRSRDRMQIRRKRFCTRRRHGLRAHGAA